jgi:hypothetical protein
MAASIKQYLGNAQFARLGIQEKLKTVFSGRNPTWVASTGNTESILRSLGNLGDKEAGVKEILRTQAQELQKKMRTLRSR